MTKEEFENKYGQNGMVKVSTEFPYDVIKDLMPYFEKIKSLRQNAGEEPYTLEAFLERILSLGSEHSMLKNAILYSLSEEVYYEKKY